MCTPPANARSDSPRCSPATAWCTAASDEEQAVSTARAGPCSPSANATRPMAVLKDVPATEYRLAAGSEVSFPSRTRPR